MKWQVDHENGNRLVFEYANHFIDIMDEDELVRGVHIEKVQESVESLIHLLNCFDVIWNWDPGEGEPSIWLKL